MDQGTKISSVAVIGLGLIGSAACRYLSLESDSSVVGIGPPEPANWKTYTGVFASHYDEGRITRIVDKDDVWSKLAARSIASYRSIEEESGIKFHHPVGSLRVTPFHKQDGDSMVAAYETGKANGAAVTLIENGGELRKQFPYFQFQDSHAGVMETGGAGCINPRALVRAQLHIAAKHGARIIPETVVGIQTSDGVVRVTTDAGKVVLASKVLMCAGAYTNRLIPGHELVFQAKLVSILLAEVGESDAEKLKSMPSIIWRLEFDPFFHNVYACPPLPYPDGKLYLKIGGEGWEPYVKSAPEDVVEWFHGNGRDIEIATLRQILLQLLPEIAFESWRSKPCIVTYTPSNYPYVTAVDGKAASEAQVFVAAGGCGAAAKSSDEIGRMGALLVSDGVWKYDLSETLFRGVFMRDEPVTLAAALKAAYLDGEIAPKNLATYA